MTVNQKYYLKLIIKHILVSLIIGGALCLVSFAWFYPVMQNSGDNVANVFGDTLIKYLVFSLIFTFFAVFIDARQKKAEAYMFLGATIFIAYHIVFKSSEALYTAGHAGLLGSIIILLFMTTIMGAIGIAYGGVYYLMQKRIPINKLEAE